MPLDMLPADVLMEITDFLPTSSVASLALCNKNICAKIGTQSWKDLSSWRQSPQITRLRQERVALLTCLQLDLTDWIYCYRCEKLCHRSDHNPSNRSNNCIKASGVLDLIYAQGDSGTGAPSKVYSLVSLDLQLLMSHHRALRRDTSQDQLSDPRVTDLLSNLRMVAHLGVADKGRCVIDARVVDDELLIRIKTQLLFADPQEFDQIQMYLPEICRHASTRGDIFWPSDMDRSSQPKWENTFAYSTHSRVPYRCGFCRTDYLATIEKKPQTANYLVEVTVWKNLGSFKSPFDKKWQRHRFRGEIPFWFRPQISQGMIYRHLDYADEEGILSKQEELLKYYMKNGKMVTLQSRRIVKPFKGLPSHYCHSSLARNG